jgi:hypothetical protein
MNPRIARLAFLVLALAACVNLAAGATLALRDPARASDLSIMYDWCGRWLAGDGLYTAPDGVTDYPPNAIVMLSPLARLPWPWLVPLWTAFGLALAPLLAYLVVRCVWLGDPFVAAVPMLLFLCWTGTRTLLQFSALSMTLAFLSLRLVDSHRLASSVALGLALFKPHIAGPIALWMVVTGRARVAIVAAAVVLAGWTAYDARIGENPLTTLEGYLGVLGRLHAGPDGLLGRTDLRGWSRIVTADPRAADALWIAVSTLLLAGAWWLARRDPRRPLAAGGLAVLSLFCLWSLLAFYHNTNNLIMMVPAFVFLWFLDDRSALPRRWVPIVLLQAALMFDVPTRLGPRMPHDHWARAAVEDFDRVLVLASFAYVAIRWHRLTSRRVGDGPSGRTEGRLG